jgi:hypothetical protein
VFAKFGLLMARSSFLAPRSSHPKEGHLLLGKRRNRQDCSRNEESSESQGESLSE